MCMRQQEFDEVQARFTNWLNVILLRAKLHYVQQARQKYAVISLEELPESAHPGKEDIYAFAGQCMGFDFEEQKLADAFRRLSQERQWILELLFIEGRKPKEISKILHCSAQHVYDQRYQALQFLKQILLEEGDKV